MGMYREWVLTLGIMAVTPGLVMGGPFSFLKVNRKAKPVSRAVTKRPAPPNRAKSRNQQIAEDVAAALRAAKLNGYDIQIEYQHGVARLTGVIGNAKQKAKATSLVARVNGVKTVDNQLTLLQKASELPANKVVAAQKSKAKSRLPNPFRKSLLKTAVFRKKKRRSISRATQPVGGSARKPRPLGAVTGRPVSQRSAPRDNQKVAEEIAAALKSAKLHGYDIEIRYHNGRAELNGNVSSEEQKRKATQVVAQVRGVKKVANRLQFGDPTAQLAGQPTPPAGTARRVVAPQGYTMAGPPANPYQYAGPMPSGPQYIPNVPYTAAIPVAYQVSQPAGPTTTGAAPPPNAAAPDAGPGPPPPGIPAPPSYGHPGRGATHTVYNMPHLPNYAWPSYANYPNYAQVTYPKQYSASAWPYIGPFYPYPQIPLGWRQVQLEWDDGYWNLNFNARTDKWYWFLNPKNW